MLWPRCSPSENGSRRQDCSVSTRPTRLIARELGASAAHAEKGIAAGIAMLCLLGLMFVNRRAQGQETAPIRRSQIVHSFRLTKFYDTPEPLPAGKPGDLIRSVDFDQYDLPGDVSAVRILYHSRSAKGEDIATSGVVLFPDKKTPTGGWPVIAWAHDLNGVARDCAPSLARSLRSGSFLTMYVNSDTPS